MFRKTAVKGLAVAALVAGAAQPAQAVTWGGNNSYCAGSLFITCFSVNLSWTGNVATLTVLNDGTETDLIKAIGITNIPGLPGTWSFALSGTTGSLYCRSGIDQGCPNEIGGIPGGQFDEAAVAASNDQDDMPGDGESGTWIFTFSGFADQAAIDAALGGASVGGHFISGPNGCSTKWYVTSTGSYNEGPTDPECGETTIPEPATMMLLATGLVGLGGASFLRRRKRNS